jgi:broad specificity phosphatase PhoE
MKLVVVRHGRTEGNYRRRVVGKQNLPLDYVGNVQSVMLCERLNATLFSKIWCSDLLRAQQTLRYLNVYLKGLISFSPLLREKSFGHYENRPIKVYERTVPEEWSKLYEFVPSGGESFKSTDLRVRQFLQESQIAEEKPNPLHTELVCAHATINRSIIGHLTELSFEQQSNIPQSCANYTELHRTESGKWKIITGDDTTHLTE